MRPGVRADGVAGRGHLLENFGMPAGVLADREEQRLGALVGQRLEHALGVARPRAVVERQHDLVVAQEVVGLEVLEAEAGAAGGVDLDHALDAERIRIVTFGLGHDWRGGRGGGGAAAGAGAAAGPCAFCAQTAAPAVDIDIARAIAKALRITFSIPVRG